MQAQAVPETGITDFRVLMPTERTRSSGSRENSSGAGHPDGHLISTLCRLILSDLSPSLGGDFGFNEESHKR